MTTITPEERKQWRERHTIEPYNYGHRVIRLLDALDEAEATMEAREERYMDDRHTWQTLASDMKARAEKAERARDRLIEALTPSADTKCAYSSEVKDGRNFVSWIAIKDIMKLIRDRATQEHA